MPPPVPEQLRISLAVIRPLGNSSSSCFLDGGLIELTGRRIGPHQHAHAPIGADSD
jgi:hypothetical protein